MGQKLTTLLKLKARAPQGSNYLFWHIAVYLPLTLAKLKAIGGVTMPTKLSSALQSGQLTRARAAQNPKQEAFSIVCKDQYV